MRIIMTGMGGGIGSYISDALRGRGHTVIAGRFAGDIGAQTGVECDVLILCAASPLERHRNAATRARAIAADIAMTSDVLSWVTAKHVIYLSSATVYGKRQLGDSKLAYEPEQDDGNRDGARVLRFVNESIAFAKLACERIVRDSTEATKTPHTIYRLFNVISPRERVGPGAHVQVDLYRQIVTERAPVITTRTTGTEARAWTWVGDISDAIADRLDPLRRDPTCMHACEFPVSRTYNLGAHESVTVRTLAREMLHAARRVGAVPADYEPTFAWGKNHAACIPIPDTFRAQRELGFEYTTTLGECMERFIRGRAAQ